MAKCKKCGNDAALKSSHLCYQCLTDWQTRRINNYKQVLKELGILNPENLEGIKQRVKKLEKEQKRMER